MMKEVEALTPAHKFDLLSTVCNSNILLGDMLTSNSPLDVSFFNIHAEVTLSSLVSSTSNNN